MVEIITRDGVEEFPTTDVVEVHSTGALLVFDERAESCLAGFAPGAWQAFRLNPPEVSV